MVGILSLGSRGFQGGKTQFNTEGPQYGGDYPFINLMKGAQTWSYTHAPTDPNVPQNNPISELDANGYVTSIVAGTNGVYTVFQFPNNNQYSGNWVLKWDGNGSLSLNAITKTTVSGSLDNTAGGAGRYVFTRTDNNGSTTGSGLTVITVNAAPNYVRNIRLCKAANEAAMDAGAQFDPDSLALLESLNPGVIRSLGWGGIFSGTNNSFVALWSQRMPTTYFSYASSYNNAAFYGGRTTNSGSDYTLAYNGFSLTNKVCASVLFNATAPQSGQTTITINTTALSAINITWTAHGLAAGNTVAFGNNSSPPAPLVSATTYFVKTVVDANTFTISATSGGAAINATGTASGVTFFGASIPRININGTGFVPMTGNLYPVPNNVFMAFNVQYPIANTVQHLVYDATLGWFYLSQGAMIAGVPPEVFIDYCAAVGAHPHMVAPFLSIEPVSDYMTSWVTYAKNTYPWMKPRVEPPNETWNAAGQFYATQYSQGISYVLWGTSQDIGNAYGKWCSTLGQAISAIYGNDRTKYSMICSVQTVSLLSNSTPGAAVDARLKSTLYVANNGGDPAYKWVDRVCGANYFSPTERFTCQELIDAYNYAVTYAADPTQQAIIANAYIATASGSVANFTVQWATQCFTNMKAWALAMPGGSTIAGITCYEGGWSPDYLSGNWTTGITGASKASSCVLTLATTSGNSEASGFTGNPAVVGMSVTPSGIVGMTQLNGNTYTITAVSGNLITINVDSSAFTTYTSGGTLTYVNSQTYTNAFRGPACKAATGLGTMNTQMNTAFFALGQAGFVAEYPSNFLLTGTGNVWSVLDPDIYAALTPQWNSIVAANK